MIVVDSIMTLQYKQDMFDLFNKIEDHIIEKNIRALMLHTGRTAYKGKYRIPTYGEFFLRLRRFIGDKVTTDDKDWLEYTEKL